LRRVTGGSSLGSARNVAMIAKAYLSGRGRVSPDISQLISAIAASLDGLPEEGMSRRPVRPAVPIERSITYRYLICLEDGMQVTLLRRHLRTRFGLSPEAYRRRWGLPSTYPMVAMAYSLRRALIAKGPRRSRAPGKSIGKIT
jgi:predicted transcriptional regulator